MIAQPSTKFSHSLSPQCPAPAPPSFCVRSRVWHSPAPPLTQIPLLHCPGCLVSPLPCCALVHPHVSRTQVTPRMEERMLEAEGKSPQSGPNKTQPMGALTRLNLARPFLPPQPESLPVGTWGSPTLTLVSLELTKTLLLWQVSIKTSVHSRGEWEGGSA